MPEQPKKFYVTTPIYYVNARPHIGHAYTTIVADVLARRHRLLGDDTFFLTGTDEHGQKIERSAAAAGIPPQQFADQVSAEFRTLWDRMGLTYNQFIRTTDEAHKRGVQKLFSTLYENGHIYLSSYTGQYCVSDETFVDVPVGAPCPECGRQTETVTEENFFFRLSAFQLPLLDLIESDTLAITPESRKNEVLSFLRGNVSSLLTNPESGGIVPALEQAIASGRLHLSAANNPYLPGALKDLSISRSSFTWGIPVPEPAASLTKDPHIIYVWLDALANYMTAVGYGDDSEEGSAKFARYWPADLHLVGKEIIRFHCVYWPAFLLALNPAAAIPAKPHLGTTKLDPPNRSGAPFIAEPHPAMGGSQPPKSATSGAGAPHLASETSAESPQLSPDDHKLWAEKMLPKAIAAHGWLLFDDSKMSKSKGNIVRTETILQAFGTLCPPAPRMQESVPPSADGANASLKGTALAVPSTTHSGDAALAAEAISPSPRQRDLFAADVLRYFLLREIPFGQDGSFSFEALITRYNADLANGYGNLVSRVMSMMTNYFEGTVPTSDMRRHSQLMEEHQTAGATKEFQERQAELPQAVQEDFASTAMNRCLERIQEAIGALDRYLTAQAPWRSAIELDAERARARKGVILYTAAESIRIITALLYPILPYSTARVWAQLGLGDIEEAARNGDLRNLQWGGLKPGTKLGPLSPIFPRADKGLAQIMSDMESQKTQQAAQTKLNPSESASGERNPASNPGEPAADVASFDPGAPPRTGTLAGSNPGAQVGGSNATTPERAPTPPHAEANASGIFAGQSAPNTPADASPQITIDDFAKVELRVAKVLVCERIPKADKLLRLEVDLGYERRQILSGIAEWYTPEDLLGRRIVVITNLAPRKMRGLESHGMLLAASAPEGGKPALATFLDADSLPLGSRLK